MDNCFSYARGHNSNVVPKPQARKGQREAWELNSKSMSIHSVASADCAKNGNFELTGSKTSFHWRTRAKSAQSLSISRTQEGVRRASTPSENPNSKKTTPLNQSSSKLVGIQGGIEKRKNTPCTELDRKNEGLDTRSSEKFNKL